MRNTAKVLEFAPKQDEFAAHEIRVPKIPRNLDDTIALVKPIFEEWILAEHTFEHNTLEVAKAVSRAWDLFKVSQPDGTKAVFARLFDDSIPEDAKVRDLVDNSTYNRIQYLLHKVAPGGGGSRTSAKDRTALRVKVLRGEWKRFARGFEKAGIEDLQAFVAHVLAEFLPETVVDKILS